MRKFMTIGVSCMLFICAIMCFCMTGCSEATRQSSIISREADNFQKPRKLTIINTRTDKIVVELIGTFSVQHSEGELDILCAIGDDKYTKDFFDLNEWTIYSVEDCTTDDVKLYDRVIKYYPENKN